MITIVYDHGRVQERSTLWEELIEISMAAVNKEQAVIGDFNEVLFS